MKEADKKRLVGLVSEVQCAICKKKYTPTDRDISLNGNFYYKNCQQCRAHRVELKKISIAKKLSQMYQP